jgi:RNA polymerase sigma factor (sigma-70 family)
MPLIRSTGLDQLAARYRTPLRRFFERRLRLNPDPEDLVQEVFVRLIRQAELTDVNSLDAYVFQVAANVLRDHARRWSLREAESNHLQLDDQEIPGGHSPERIVLGRLHATRSGTPRVTRALPLRQRLRSPPAVCADRWRRVRYAHEGDDCADPVASQLPLVHSDGRARGSICGHRECCENQRAQADEHPGARRSTTAASHDLARLPNTIAGG